MSGKCVVWLREEVLAVGFPNLQKFENLKQRKGVNSKLSIPLLVSLAQKYLRMKEREKKTSEISPLPIPFISYNRWKKIATSHWDSLDEKEALVLSDHFLLVQPQSGLSGVPSLLHESNNENLKKSHFHFFQFLVFMALMETSIAASIQQILQNRFSEQSQKKFLQTHLPSLLQLLATNLDNTDEKGITNLTSGQTNGLAGMNGHQFQYLDFLFCGGKTTKSQTSLLHLTPFWPSDLSIKVPLDILNSWIQENFIRNEYCYSSQDFNSSPALPSFFSSSSSPSSALTSEGNEAVMPSVIIENLENTTIVKTEKNFSINTTSFLQINNCANSTLYILTTTRYIRVTNCTSCVIVLGPSCKASLEACEYVTLIAACKAILIRMRKEGMTTTISCFVDHDDVIIFFGSQFLKVGLVTNTRPVIRHDNFQLELGPFNTHYSSLEDQLRTLNIRTELTHNYWSEPLLLLPNQKTKEGTEKLFELIQPHKFSPFVVPFSGLSGNTSKNPCELPVEFLKSLQTRTHQINIFRSLLTQLDPNIQKQLYSIIQANFQEWLQQTGNMKQVYDLFQLKSWNVSN